MARQTAESGTVHRPSVFRIGAISFVGTAMEFYAIQAYGTAAALVFPKLFFPVHDPVISTLLAYGTLAISYASRPLGGTIFGHLGDKIGRKNTLVATLVVMGVATICIGLLPGYATIGVAAPILLLLLAMVQAAAFGGEWGGGVLVAYEFAPPGKRNLFASLPQVGLPMGSMLANLVWTIVTGSVHGDDLMTWGWRIPFLLSAIVVIGGVIVRLSIGETPEFQHEVKEKGDVAKAPVLVMLRTSWKEALLTSGSFLGFGLNATLSIVFLIDYTSKKSANGAHDILTVLMISTLLQLVVMPLGGYLADKFGNRPIVLLGAFGTAITVFFQYWLVDIGGFVPLLIGYVVCFVFFSAINYGPMAGLFAAAFATRTRYSGLAVGQSIANVLGGIGPIVATSLLVATGSLMSVAGYVFVMLALSTACLTVLSRRLGREATNAGAAVSTAKV